MSRAAARSQIDPLGARIAQYYDPVKMYHGTGSASGDAAQADYEAGQPGRDAAAAAAAAETERTRGRDFALREELLGRQARAGGATRSGNEADLLGFAPGTRRRNASRTLLG